MPALSKPKLIIIDWDGTLADTHHLIRQALDHTCKTFKRPPFTKSQFEQSVSRSVVDTFADFFGAEKDAAYQAYYNYVESHPRLIIPIVGAKNFLDIAQAKHIPMMVISFKRQDLLDREMERFGWGSYFVSVVGRDHFNKDFPVKPDPKVFEEALKRAGIKAPDKDHTWMIGDGSNDIRLAHNLGIKAVAFGENPITDDQDVHFHARTFDDLIPFL